MRGCGACCQLSVMGSTGPPRQKPGRAQRHSRASFPLSLGRVSLAHGRPELRQRAPVGRAAKLLERAFPDLSDALAGDAHQLTDPLERHGLGPFLEAVVEMKDSPLTRSEILLEHAIDELTHELRVRCLLDLTAVHTGEALAEGRRFAVGAIDGCVEG